MALSTVSTQTQVDAKFHEFPISEFNQEQTKLYQKMETVTKVGDWMRKIGTALIGAAVITGLVSTALSLTGVGAIPATPLWIVTGVLLFSGALLATLTELSEKMSRQAEEQLATALPFDRAVTQVFGI